MRIVSSERARQGKVLQYILSHPVGPFKTEAEMLKRTKDVAHMLGCLVVREESEVRGRSDILLCYRGSFVALELKDDIGTPSAHQIQFIKDVLNAGGRAAVCNDMMKVFRTITGDGWDAQDAFTV